MSTVRLTMAQALVAAMAAQKTVVGGRTRTLAAPGGYRFEDYPRLGAPLSLMVLCVAPPTILTFWPL